MSRKFTFLIIFLPFLLLLLGGVEAQQQPKTTEVYETLNLGPVIDRSDGIVVEGETFTKLSILPSSSIAPTGFTSESTTTFINEPIYSLPTLSEADYTTTESSSLSSPPPSIFPSYCFEQFECHSTSFTFDILAFLHLSEHNNSNNNGTLTCFHSIYSCREKCSRFFEGHCYRAASNLVAFSSSSFNPNNCGEVNYICFFAYHQILAITMILTTIAIISAIVAVYKLIKARRASNVSLLSFHVTTSTPDLRNIHNTNDVEELNIQNTPQPYESVRFDNENSNVTIISTKSID